MNKYYPLTHKLTPPDTTPTDTATIRLAPIHLRVARMVLWVFIWTCESSPTATHSAVSERSVPLFYSVAPFALVHTDRFHSECYTNDKGSNQTCENNIMPPTDIQHLNIHVRNWIRPQTSQPYTNRMKWTATNCSTYSTTSLYKQDNPAMDS